MDRRRSARLKGWDYGTPDAYFVAVVTHLRRSWFGTIDGEGMVTRSGLGMIAEAEWWRTATVFPNAHSPVFVLMPNHVHGIVYLNLDPDPTCPPAHLSTFVGSYKSAVSRRVGAGIWQRSFYDRIIREERDLAMLWDYIESNPGRWAEDHENPEHPRRAGQAPPLRT